MMLLTFIVFNFWNAVYTHANVVAKGQWSVRGQSDVIQQQSLWPTWWVLVISVLKVLTLGGRQYKRKAQKQEEIR